MKRSLPTCGRLWPPAALFGFALNAPRDGGETRPPSRPHSTIRSLSYELDCSIYGKIVNGKKRKKPNLRKPLRLSHLRMDFATFRPA
jgi:hypothetical protein